MYLHTERLKKWIGKFRPENFDLVTALMDAFKWYFDAWKFSRTDHSMYIYILRGKAKFWILLYSFLLSFNWKRKWKNEVENLKEITNIFFVINCVLKSTPVYQFLVKDMLEDIKRMVSTLKYNSSRGSNW